jgi:hypothetical protein
MKYQHRYNCRNIADMTMAGAKRLLDEFYHVFEFSDEAV